jgi:molecular chaperone GrpE
MTEDDITFSQADPESQDTRQSTEDNLSDFELDIDEIRSELDRLRDENEKLDGSVKILAAEYDNFRKRSKKERENAYVQAKTDVVEKFLPVLDNMERAASFGIPNDEFGKGFEKILQSFGGVLGELSIEPIGEAGEQFDPNLHNAVMHIEDETLGTNVVSQVLQKGYKVGGKVIRHAMVQTAN